jgi:hypothetical protein
MVGGVSGLLASSSSSSSSFSFSTTTSPRSVSCSHQFVPDPFAFSYPSTLWLAFCLSIAAYTHQSWKRYLFLLSFIQEEKGRINALVSSFLYHSPSILFLRDNTISRMLSFELIFLVNLFIYSIFK